MAQLGLDGRRQLGRQRRPAADRPYDGPRHFDYKPSREELFGINPISCTNAMAWLATPTLNPGGLHLGVGPNFVKLHQLAIDHVLKA